MGPTSKGRGGRGREKGEGERKRGEEGGGEGREPPHYKFLAVPLPATDLMKKQNRFRQRFFIQQFSINS